MAEKLLTIAQILSKLNHGTTTQPWAEIPGIFSLNVGNIEKDTVVTKGESLVLKCFINQETGEIRQYLSKFTDEPLTRDLP